MPDPVGRSDSLVRSNDGQVVEKTDLKKYVLLYESADDVASRAVEHFPAHSALWGKFQAQGTLLMIGTFGNPQEEGSMGIFTTGRQRRSSLRATHSWPTGSSKAGRFVSGTRR
jgi:uncharacterized protein